MMLLRTLTLLAALLLVAWLWYTLRPSTGIPGPITVEIEPTSLEATVGSTIEVPVTVTNRGPLPYRATFGSSCTEPDLSIDGQHATQLVACLTVMTDVTVLPGQSEQYMIALQITAPNETLPLESEATASIALDPGSHQLVAEWNGLTNTPVLLEIRPR